MAIGDQPGNGADCAKCREPLDPDDRFCGTCGAEAPVRAPVPGSDRPTVALSTPPHGTPLGAPQQQGVFGGPPGTPPHGTAVGSPGSTGSHASQPSRPSQPSAPAQPAHPPRPPQPPAAQPSAPQPGSAPHGGTQWPGAPEVDSADQPVPVQSASQLTGRDSADRHEADSAGGPQGSYSRSAGQPAPQGEFGPAEHSAPPGSAPAPAPEPEPEPAAEPEAPAAPAEPQEDRYGGSGLGAFVPPAPAGAKGNGSADASVVHDHRSPAPGSAAAGTPGTERLPGEDNGTITLKVCVACRRGRVDDDGYCENCGHAQPRERDHQERTLDQVAAVSDRGLRHHRNEDAFAVSSALLPDGTSAVIAVVCDGVSSSTRPDEASLAASRAAAESLQHALPQGTHPQTALHEAIVAASGAVNALAPHGGAEQNAPACTLVSAIVAGDLLIVGWVGDSRVYWVPVDRSAPAARLTEDDSWAAQMVSSGLMSEEEAYADARAHAITGWLGADAYEVEPHTTAFKPDRPGVVLVCTDGLWNYAEAAEDMARVLPTDASERPLHSAQVLVGHALDGGGHDNVTVAVLPFPARDPGHVSA